MRFRRLEHRFVHNIPEVLEGGVLYVSIDYATAVHSCCCGCGEEVVTPLSPTDWSMTFDGETVSLSPSIGNWLLPCRTHYVVRRDVVIEAGRWSEAQIKGERERDRHAKAGYYGTTSEIAPVVDRVDEEPSRRPGLWTLLRRWIGL